MTNQSLDHTDKKGMSLYWLVHCTVIQKINNNLLIWGKHKNNNIQHYHYEIKAGKNLIVQLII